MLALASLVAALAVSVVANNNGANSNGTDDIWGSDPDQFTPVDMLSTPRPQAAIAAPGGQHAISVVDQWDEKEDS